MTEFYKLVMVVLYQLCAASEVSFRVRYLDRKVCDSIQNPVSLGGKYLYRDLLDLAIFLQGIEHTMKDGNREGDKEAINILEEGGLKLPNITQDDLEIMEAFNWTKSQAEELRRKTLDVVSRWHTILQVLKRQPVYPVDYDIDSDKFLKTSLNNVTDLKT